MMFYDFPVKIPSPCHKPNEPDCSDRRVKCQTECEKYKAYREKLDASRAEAQKAMDSWDYVSQSISKKKRSLRFTEAGRKALSQR